jgi:hypothetical protein
MTSTHLSRIEKQTNDLATLDREAESIALKWLLAYASVRTRQNYQAALSRFAQFMAMHKAGSALEATRTHLDAWSVNGSRETCTGFHCCELGKCVEFLRLCSFMQCSSKQPMRESPKAESVRHKHAARAHFRKCPQSSDRSRGNECEASRCSCSNALWWPSSVRGLQYTASDIGEELGHMVLSVQGKGGTLGKVVLPPAAMSLLAECSK